MNTLPLRVEHLETWIPHRPPAIWVSEVVCLLEDGGECRVNLDLAANYCTDGMVRASAYIEWMAQSYAYVRAYEVLSGQTGERAITKAFLAAVTDFEVTPEGQGLSAQAGRKVSVIVRKERVLGPITMVSGQILEGKKVLASARLKVFSES